MEIQLMESSQQQSPASGTNSRLWHRFGFVCTIFNHFLERIRSIAMTRAPQTYTYESQHRIFGLPLLSINLGPDTPCGKMRHAKGIIAIGSKATGVIAVGVFIARGFFTIGFLGFGFFTISIAGIGLFSVCAFGLGIVAVAVVAIGYLAVGILAVGFSSVGIIAIGVKAVGIIGIGQHIDSMFPLNH